MKKSVKLTTMVAGGALALAGAVTAVTAGDTTRHPDAAAPPGAARAQRVADINPTVNPAAPNLHNVTVKVKNRSLFTLHICLTRGLNSPVCTGDLARNGAAGQATDSFADGSQNAQMQIIAMSPDNFQGDSLEDLPPVTADATYCYVIQDEFGNVYSTHLTDCTGF